MMIGRGESTAALTLRLRFRVVNSRCVRKPEKLLPVPAGPVYAHQPSYRKRIGNCFSLLSRASEIKRSSKGFPAGSKTHAYKVFGLIPRASATFFCQPGENSKGGNSLKRAAISSNSATNFLDSPGIHSPLPSE